MIPNANNITNFNNQIKIQLTNDNKCLIQALSESPIKSQNTIQKDDFSINDDMSLSKSNNSSYNNNIKKLITIFNFNRKKEAFFNSKNEKAFNQILSEINNLKKSKLNKNNDLCPTFRSIKNNNENYNKNTENINQKIFTAINSPIKKPKLIDEDYLKTEESTKVSINNSNQFFYNVYKSSVKKYPYLHLLRNKINKMRYNDISKSQKKLRERNNRDNHISLLEKIKSQKNIFQQEIDEIFNSK
jgi:hypothetical protein